MQSRETVSRKNSLLEVSSPIQPTSPTGRLVSKTSSSFTVAVDSNIERQFTESKVKAKELNRKYAYLDDTEELKRMKATYFILRDEKPKQWNNIPVPITDLCHHLIVQNSLQYNLNQTFKKDIEEVFNLIGIMPKYYDQYLENMPRKINEILA
jgi:hypothetical protein